MMPWRNLAVALGIGVLRVVDECPREALAIRMARQLSSSDVIDVLADLFVAQGAPAQIRSDQGGGVRGGSSAGLDRGRRDEGRLHREGECVGARLRRAL
jgi:hypothetical protein